ncbi:uncharacterized protein BP5553_07959 [Venustampulla echinocandica]|uniref:Cep57 centrosome microtubule-binding domain-containing protein n=1 Tax=Venustampulla echinocandica TaxID=2656787 RepID=A0A370TFD9_9HELO|nr:uncharacterized protein BP5553_07959 [Venustampulla echinocandica]RDL33591.1 hypothetical protein BP5553_07959 [Venustampulla echinocandica]
MSTAFPPSRHRSRMARERSRDVNNSMLSVASSTGSNHGTVSTDSTISTDFDPIRDEACMSTQQLNTNYSQKLPELRDTAKKYGRWQPRSQQEFVINTSAIGRAFPDFSHAGSSDDTFNVEVGRAPTRHPSNPRVEYSGSPSSPIITMGSTKILHTPKRTSTNHSILQDALRNRSFKETAQHNSTEQKENIPPASQGSAKASPYISHASRTISGERRSLAELHARVADESDGSFIGQERPVTSTLQPPKNSRFANGQAQNLQRVSASPNVSSKRQPSEVVDEAMVRAASNTPSKPQVGPQKIPHYTTNSATPNPTQQSFLLPGMRAASDVDSGTFNNGVPVFAHGGKIHNRHTSKATLLNASFGPVDAIVVPDEEEDIYELINLLKARIARVEAENGDQKHIINDITKDNHQLALERKELPDYVRPDSALGMGDSGSDRHGGSLREVSSMNSHQSPSNSDVLTKIPGLQARIISIQNQLDASEQRVSNHDVIFKASTIERDQAVKQLAEAYLENERLQDENDSLRKERGDLLRELQQKEQQEDGSAVKELEAAQNQISLLRMRGESLEQLEFENRSLRRKNEALEKELGQFEAKSQEHADTWQKKETKLRNKILRQEEVVTKLQELTQEIHENTREITLATTSKHNGLTSHHRAESKPKYGRRSLHLDSIPQGPASMVMKQNEKRMNEVDGTNADLDITSSRGRKATEDSYNVKLGGVNYRPDPPQLNDFDQETGNARQATALGTHDASLDVDTTNGTTIHDYIRNTPGDDTLEGSSYASILGQGFMTNLRQHVRNLRDVKELQQRQRGATTPSIHDDTVQSNHPIQSSYPRSTQELVGILKNTNTRNRDEFTGCLSVRSAGSNALHAEDLTDCLSVKSAQSGKSRSHHENSQASTSHRRHHSETSVHAHTYRRHRTEKDDMTSAFIIPDIEFGSQQNGKDHPRLTPDARRVLDGLCQHNASNCILCRQVTSYGDSNATNGTKQTIRIDVPIPVSERMPIPAPYEDEPTIRPSVQPGLALATVIKGLQDEIAHLKMRQSEVQVAYNQHDSSLGRRARKTMKKTLEELLKQIDHKSDQVYALYDVLEGQKQSGQEMSDEEVERTLSNIGLNHEDTTKEGENDQDETLPWEGIEDN